MPKRRRPRGLSITFPPFIMKNTPRLAIDPKLVKELIDAGNDATDAMCESINLDLAVGNDEFDDVNDLQAALDRLSDALEKIESAGYSS